MGRQKGFTLIELMISMVIILIAMATLFMSFTLGLRLFVDESNRSEAYLEADRGMARMTKEIRTAKEIVSSATKEVTFWLDDLNFNSTRDAEETVTLTWSGSPETSLNRIVSNEVIPIAYGVINFQLTYDDPGSPTFVNILISTKKSSSIATLESSIKLRNI